MASWIRSKVSKKKRRFNQDGFDLDLTYIRDDIVAMGFPSESVEGVYRNQMKEVQRFFDTRHADNYKVYNLCSERAYDPAKFDHVASYPFDDHNAPPFELIKPFCEDVHEWLAPGGSRVAAIHCKAGKGRTGVMIAAYLLHSGMWDKAAEALQFYGVARTKNTKGVTIPSQRRYVTYYGHMLRKNLVYRPTIIFLTGIVLNGIPLFEGTKIAPMFIVRQGKTVIHTSEVYDLSKVSKKIEGTATGEEGEQAKKSNKKERSEHEQRTTAIELNLENTLPLTGDIKIEVYHKKKSNKVFHLWINTFFHNGPEFHIEKEEIDKINKDKTHKVTHGEFSIDLRFTGEVIQDGPSDFKKVNIFAGRQSGVDDESQSEENLSDDDEVNEWADKDAETNVVEGGKPVDDAPVSGMSE